MPSRLATLVKAVAEGNVAEVKSSLTEGNVNFRDSSDGVTLLARAVSRNDIAVAAVLIERGASVRIPDHRGFEPIHRAAWSGTVDMMALLLKSGADVNAAVFGQYVATQRAPMDRLAPPAGAAERKTPLILAAMRGDVQLVAFLCENGATIDQRDGFNMSAMDHASLEGKSEVVEFLLERGSDANAARVLCEYGSEHRATTVQQRGSYNDIAKTLCAVWAPQCKVTVL